VYAAREDDTGRKAGHPVAQPILHNKGIIGNIRLNLITNSILCNLRVLNPS
jgi:hypothetical protein